MTRKLIILAGIVAALALIFALDLDRYLSLAWLKAAHRDLVAAFEARPFAVAGLFMLLQAGALAINLPGAVLTLGLAGGAIFGLGWGTLIVLTAVVIGDSLGFLAARYLFRDLVQARFGRQLDAVQRGFERDGAYYLLAMRLMAVIPYFMVNLTIALTRMPLAVFAPVSFVGLAPVTAIYVNAGTQLARIETPADVMSFPTLASLGLLGLAPVVLRFAVAKLRPPSVPIDPAG